MRTRLVFGILLVASLGLAVTTSGKPPKPPLGTPVTVTLPNSGTGFAIQGDGGDYIDGEGGVTALIVPLGNLQLKTGDVRAFLLDFQGCVTAGTCSAPFQAEYTQGYMTTSCPQSLLAMDPLQWQLCNLNVHFTADGWGWFVRFGQGQDYSATPAKVTRNDTGHWTIAVPEGGIALLQRYPLKGRVTWTNHGFFFMPVSLTVTVP